MGLAKIKKQQLRKGFKDITFGSNDKKTTVNDECQQN